MKLLIRMETIVQPFITNIAYQLEKDISLDNSLSLISFPEIEMGLVVILRVYPKADFIYPAYSKQIKTFKRKDKLLIVSSNIEIEALIGLNQIEIYNIFLNRVIESMFILEGKKIKGADVGYLSSILKRLAQ